MDINLQSEYSHKYTSVAFEDLLNKVITEVHVDKYTDYIIFETNDGFRYEMYHSQDYCESVYIESIVGDVNDLLNTPILRAEEVESNDNPLSKDEESFTWTFYKLATIKGYVDIRWYGVSNGYYPESVDLYRNKVKGEINGNLASNA